MAYTKTDVGTTTVGASSETVSTTISYVKRVSLTAGQLIASVGIHLDTTGGLSDLAPVVYADNGGVPGRLIFARQHNVQRFKLAAANRTVRFPVGLPVPDTGDYWVGVDARSNGAGLALRYAAGGSDYHVTSGGQWVNEVGGVGGGATATTRDYTLWAEVVDGMPASSVVGRTTVGASSLAMTSGRCYIRRVTIPAHSYVPTIEALLKVPVATVGWVRAVAWTAGESGPDRIILAPPMLGTAVLFANVYRRFYFPFGFTTGDAAVDLYVGVQATGPVDLSRDVSVGADGFMPGASDAGVYTAGTDDYAISATVYGGVETVRLGAQTIGASAEAGGADKAYARAIDVPSDTLCVAMEAGIGGTAAALWHSVQLCEDAAGSPGATRLIAEAGGSDPSVVPSAPDRFFLSGLCGWLPAGTYHAAAQNAAGLGGATLRYDAGVGSVIDGTTESATHEPGSAGTVVTSNSRGYSLSLMVLTSPEPPPPPPPPPPAGGGVTRPARRYHRIGRGVTR